MPTLLAIETATEACSVALLSAGRTYARFEIAPLGHAALVLPMIEAVMAEAALPLSALDAIAFGRGPGGFTGVRVAVSAAQGLALALQRPLIPVSSLQALALRSEHPRTLVAFDARKGELYWAAYVRDAAGIPTLQGEEQVIAPAMAAIPHHPSWYGVGSGWRAHGAVLAARLGARLDGMDGDALPQAADILRLALPRFLLGDWVDVEDAAPVYIRASQAEENLR